MQREIGENRAKLQKFGKLTKKAWKIILLTKHKNPQSLSDRGQMNEWKVYLEMAEMISNKNIISEAVTIKLSA